MKTKKRRKKIWDDIREEKICAPCQEHAIGTAIERH